MPTKKPTTKPVTKKAAATKPVTKKAAPNKSVTKKAAPNKSVTKKAAAKMPVTKPTEKPAEAKLATATMKPAKAESSANAAPLVSSRLSWDELAALDGKDGRALTPELLTRQIVGTTLFPDLPADYEGFAEAENTAEPPAQQTLYQSGGEINYEVLYHAAMYDEEYKTHGTATFKALADAITALHGKPSLSSKKARAWEADGKEIRLNLWFAVGDPYNAKVELRVRDL